MCAEPIDPATIRFRSVVTPSVNRQSGGWPPSKWCGALRVSSVTAASPCCSRTPAPVSTANARCTPGNAENGPSAAMSATLTRTCQSVASGQASSSRVLPPPLRQGWRGTVSRAMRCRVMA